MLAYTLRLLRCWRLVTLNDTLHSHVDTFFSVVPKFSQTLSFALVAIYAFAMSGMQILSDRVSKAEGEAMAVCTFLLKATYAFGISHGVSLQSEQC